VKSSGKSAASVAWNMKLQYNQVLHLTDVTA
jgi:hypothetical protein